MTQRTSRPSAAEWRARLHLAVLVILALAVLPASAQTPSLNEYMASVSDQIQTGEALSALGLGDIVPEKPGVRLCAYLFANGSPVILWHDGSDSYACTGLSQALPGGARSMGEVFADVCRGYSFDLYLTATEDGRLAAYAPRKQSLAKYQRHGGAEPDTVCKSMDRLLEAVPVGIPGEAPAAETIGTAYVLNNGTMKFHKPKCPSVEKIKPENRSDFTGDRQTLIDRGYSPCKNCNP